VLALTVGAASAPGGVGAGAQAAARSGVDGSGGAAVSPGRVWTADLTSRQGRVMPGDSALPGREPGLSARQAAAIRAASDPAPVPAAVPAPAAEIPTSDGLGLEQFYQYSATPAGPAGAMVQVNQDNGNAAVALDLLSVPGRGLTSFVRMTYNSQDPTDSPVGPGWTLDASTIMPLGQYLRAVPGPGLPERHDAGVPIGAGMPSRVMLVDGTGAGQLFTLDRHGSTDPRDWEYHAPRGVHLYLQRTGSQDPARAWVFTRPDRTQFFFDTDGLPTAVADRVGNTSSFQYSAPLGTSGRQLAALIDPAGRRTLAFTYLTPGTLSQSPDAKLASITDLSGRHVDFAYDSRGRLVSVTQAAGSPVARAFGFTYAATTVPGGGSTISGITDPLGHATTLQYFGPQTDALHRGKVSTVIDRDGGTTTFDYAPVPAGSPGALLSTVTDAEHAATHFLLDARGRTLRSIDPLGGVTDLAWDGDNNVVRLRTPDGAVSTWIYDPLTGDPLTLVDPEGNAHGGTSGTALTYRTSLTGHVADLAAKVSPEGRRWTFDVDAYGQVISATDPVGNEPGPGAGEHSSMRYDRYGELVESTDPNGHVSRFADFTDAGMPQTSTDPLGQVTHTTYDDLGNVVSSIGPPDPGQTPRVVTATYDELGRQLTGTTTVSPTQTVTVPAPIYDADDNVLRSADADGAVTTVVYDPMGQVLSGTTPANSSVPGAPAPTQTFTYDAVGNELTATRPDGNTSGSYGTHTTHSVYDALGRRVQQVDPLGGITTFRYDPVGKLIAEVPPNGNVSGANAAQWTTTFAFDPDGRQVRQTDPTGAHTVTEYDLDGLVTASTGQLVGPTVPDSALRDYLTVTQYDADGRPLRNQVPFRDDAGNLTYHTTAFAYDADGNTIATTTPRGVAANRPDAFVQRSVYDADNRLTEQDQPYDPSDRVYNTPDKTFYTYDAVGDTLTVSNPPSAGQTRRTVTTNTYTANGWLKSTTDPWSISTGYTYDDDGRQLTSTVNDDGSAASRTLSWQYYPDGSLESRSDTGSPVGKDVVLLDDSDPNTTAASPAGAWTESSGGSNYEGSGYHLHAAGTGGDNFTWSALIPQSGTYHIAVRVPSGTGVAGLSPDPKYTIATKAATSTKQPAAPADGWADLGDFQLSQNETATVTLPEQADGAVIADAVRLVRDDNTPVDKKAKWFAYNYDPDGNATGITDDSTDAPVGNYTVGYDQLDRPNSVTPSSGGQPSVTFAYDGDGNVLSQAYGKRSDTYTYNTREQLQHAVSTTGAGAPPLTTDYQYDPAGNLQHELEGNGNTLDATYFLDGSLRQQLEKRSDGTLVSRHDLDYDADSNKISDDSRVMNADDHSAYLTDNATFQYDPRDRLTAVHKTGEPGDNDETYRHDGNGNVIDQSVDGVPTSFTYDRNRLVGSVSQGTHSEYEYDTFGRLSTVTDAGTKKVTAQHEYDGFDRQTSTRTGTGAAASTATFTYDSLDRQVSTTDSSPGSAAKTTTEQYLSLGGAVVAANTAGGPATSYFYSASGARLAQLRTPSSGSAQTSYYGYDAHSDVELLTDEHGNTRSTYGYTSYGSDQAAAFTGIDKPGSNSGGSAASGAAAGSGGSGGSGGAQSPYNSYRFNAMQVDPSSGQYDMGFRDYDPGINSFASRDSYQSALADLGLTTDPWASSEYAFGGGNPISDIEFDGHGWFGDLVSSVGNFVAKHAETITSTIVSTAVFVGCEGLTAGIGTVGCAAASGAAGGLVDQGFQCADKGGSACSVKSFAVAGVKGAVVGALGGAAGEVGGQLLGKIAPRVIDAVTSRGGGEVAEETTSETTSETANSAPKGGGDEAPHTSRPAASSDEAPPEPGGSAEGGSPEGTTCANSFAAATAVLMANGTTRPIRDVRVGDVIEDAAPGTDTPQAHTVTALHITHTDRDFVDLTFSAPHGAPGAAHVTAGPRVGGTLTSTAGHLFYDLSDGQWTPAAQLKAGDPVQGVGAATATVLALHRHTAAITTYNLTVDAEHTYFVVAGDTPVLVHNSSCGVEVNTSENSITISHAESGSGIIGNLSPEGDLTFAIGNNPALGSPLRGKQMFADVMDYFGDRVKSITGNWRYGDNLKAFNDAVANGESFGNAARTTWTAQRAAEYGFTRVKVTETDEGANGYSFVSSLFRPGK
jgi:RHS repeat-associated protein